MGIITLFYNLGRKHKYLTIKYNVSCNYFTDTVNKNEKFLFLGCWDHCCSLMYAEFVKKNFCIYWYGHFFLLYNIKRMNCIDLFFKCFQHCGISRTKFTWFDVLLFWCKSRFSWQIYLKFAIRLWILLICGLLFRIPLPFLLSELCCLHE